MLDKDTLGIALEDLRRMGERRQTGAADIWVGKAWRAKKLAADRDGRQLTHDGTCGRECGSRERGEGREGGREGETGGRYRDGRR